jgi:hypothetical protein
VTPPEANGQEPWLRASATQESQRSSNPGSGAPSVAGADTSPASDSRPGSEAAAIAADEAWGELIGSAWSLEQVAWLLDTSIEAVQDRDLLALRQRDGSTVWPCEQFQNGRPICGVEDVVRILRPRVATTWTIGSWLFSPNQDLHRQSPVDLLRDGDDEDRARVHLHARRFANADPR